MFVIFCLNVSVYAWWLLQLIIDNTLYDSRGQLIYNQRVKCMITDTMTMKTAIGMKLHL